MQLAFLLLISTLAAAQIKDEGDICLAASGGYPAWVCKINKNCPTALRLMGEGKHPPIKWRCGFKGPNSMTCCPPYDINNWGDTTPRGSQPTTKAPAPPPTPATIKPTNGPPVTTSPAKQSKASAMCKKYSELIYENDSVLQLFSGSSEPVRRKHCDNVAPTIVGGVNATEKEFPHMALVGFGSPPKYHCGGSLISERFVLTAAHCERHPRFGYVSKVLLGELDTSTDTDDAQPKEYDVVRRIPHPKYRSPSTYNDIMLLELKENVAFSLYVRPLCLFETTNIGPKQGIATGWGKLETVGPSSPRLQKVNLPFVSHAKCYAAFKSNVGSSELKNGIDDATQLCAGAEKGKDSCQGDSGGPIQILLGDCIYSQVGVVSFGRACGSEGVPGVYTRVSAYVSWIEKIVWP